MKFCIPRRVPDFFSDAFNLGSNVRGKGMCGVRAPPLSGEFFVKISGPPPLRIRHGSSYHMLRLQFNIREISLRLTYSIL